MISACDRTESRNKIIAEIFNCPKFNTCLKKMKPSHLQDDLKSEVMMILLKQPPGRIEKLHSNGKLSFFAIKTLIKTNSYERSKFSKTFKVPFAPEEDIPQIQCDELNGRVDRELKQEPVLDILLRIRQLAYQDQPSYVTELLPKVTWYKQYMLSLYMKVGNYRAIEDETGIPWKACYLTIRDALNELKELSICPTR